MPDVAPSPTRPAPDAEIWIIGGYGDVGQKLARLLLATGSHHVVLVGRNAEKARTAAAHLGANARGAHVDAAEGLPEEAQVVVNFVETFPPPRRRPSSNAAASSSMRPPTPITSNA